MTQGNSRRQLGSLASVLGFGVDDAKPEETELTENIFKSYINRLLK